jgi:uncharacterized delta-60 repeat protein
MKLRNLHSKSTRNIFIAFLTIFIFSAKILAAGGLDPTFDTTSLSYDVTEVQTAIQPDGKILVIGDFDRVGGIRRNGLARLNADGSLDESFNTNDPGVDRTLIKVIKLQPDGKVLVGGSFGSYLGTPVKGLVRLNPDGTIDTTFQNDLGSSPFDIISIELQPDGKILVGSRGNVARLNSNGSIDTTFTSSFAFRLRGLFLLSNGKIIVTTVTDKGISFAKRLNADGTFDANLTIGNAVGTLREQPDGKFLVGGNPLGKFNADGSRDTTFTSSFGFVSDIELTADSKILIAREGSIFRLLANGTIDTTFDSAANKVLTGSISVQTDGRIIVSGNAPTVAPPTVPRAIARLLPNGAVDMTFNVILSKDSGVVRNVQKVSAQPDNKVLILGEYQGSDGQTRRGVMRLNADGKRDASFQDLSGYALNASGRIYSFELLRNGKILVAGTNNGISQAIYLAKLNPDGTPDHSFNAAVNGNRGNIFGITEQPDDKILLSSQLESPDGRKYLIRLNADGSLDSSYTPAGDIFNKPFVYPNGKILVSSKSRNGLSRFNSDGTPDTTFNRQISGEVLDFAVQPDGKIIIGGAFDFLNNGGSNVYLARLNADGTRDASFTPVVEYQVKTVDLQRDNKILITGTFGKVNNVVRNGLALLNPDGSLNSYNPSTSPSNVINDVEIQPDGKILLGGDKIEIFGETRYGVVRLLNLLAAPFDFDGDGKSDISVFRPSNTVWYQLRSASGFTAAQFGASTDRLVPADYDGDGRTDLAVYRPFSNGEWSIRRSSDNNLTILNFGTPEDVPRPGDFDGDGKSDIAVWRPSNGVWYRLNSSNNQFVAVQFGANGDAPIIGDFDGDGKSDFAVYRSSNGSWHYFYSSDNRFSYVQFGAQEDKPAVGDFDGDGKTDISVWRPSNGVWYRVNSNGNQFSAVQFGANGDIPTAGDFDGDGRADTAVFRPSNGVWYLLQSRDGFTAAGFGLNADKPIPSAYIP